METIFASRGVKDIFKVGENLLLLVFSEEGSRVVKPNRDDEHLDGSFVWEDIGPIPVFIVEIIGPGIGGCISLIIFGDKEEDIIVNGFADTIRAIAKGHALMGGIECGNVLGEACFTADIHFRSTLVFGVYLA